MADRRAFGSDCSNCFRFIAPEISFSSGIFGFYRCVDSTVLSLFNLFILILIQLSRNCDQAFSNCHYLTFEVPPFFDMSIREIVGFHWRLPYFIADTSTHCDNQ
jgi:hypothetical protein